MPEKNLESILLMHIVIHPAEEWDLPSLDEIDYSLWEKGKGVKRLVLERLYRFLNGPYIEDNFKDHEERREWRSEMEGKYPWFYGYYAGNALRVNMMAQVAQSAMRLLRIGYKGQREEEFEALA